MDEEKSEIRLNTDTVIKIFEFCDVKCALKLRKISRFWWFAFQKIDPMILIKQIESKHSKLSFFIAFYAHLPPQRSRKWLKGRIGDTILRKIMAPPTVGGSEMSTIAGKNKYSNMKKFYKAKLGLESFMGNMATRWGKIFECVITNLIEIRFKTRVYESGAIPYGLMLDENGYPLIRYSSDGLLCVKYQLLKRVFEQELGTSGTNNQHFIYFSKQVGGLTADVIVNLEIKCPASTIPMGKVPIQYRAQPKTGSCVLPIVDINIFLNNMIRKCAIKDFGFNDKFDTKVHFPYNLKGEQPIICGFLGFYKAADKNTRIVKNSPEFLGKVKENIRFICKSIQLNVTSKGSDFYMMAFSIENVPSFVAIAKKLIPSDFKYNIDAQLLIVWNSICRLYGDKQEFTKNKSKFKQLTINVFNAIETASHQYAFGYLDFGEDYGGPLEKDVFENALKQTEEDVTVYYPKEYYFPINSNWGDSVVDMSLCEKDRALKWLWKQIFMFCKFCENNNQTPVGVMPWKLFKCDLIPMYRKPNYVGKYEEIIRATANQILQIKRKALESAEYGSEKYKEICEKEIEKIFGSDESENEDEKSQFHMYEKHGQKKCEMSEINIDEFDIF